MVGMARGPARAAVLLMLIVLVGAPAGARADERGPAATLTVLSAPVERTGAEGRPATAASGADLAVGDRVMTGPEGRALITFLDGSTVTVEPASEVTVRQAEMDGREASRLRVLIIVGTVWARVAGWLGGRATVTLESNTYSATAHDGLIGAQQDKAGTFVCWTRAGNLEVKGPSGVAARLEPGQKVTIAAGAAPRTERFAVNRSTLEIATSGPVLPLVTMSDRARRAGFMPPGVEVNQVFGSLTRGAGDGAGGTRVVEVPAGVSGPFVVRLTAVGDGPFTVTIVGRHQGTETYRYQRTGTAQHGQGARFEVIQTMEAPPAGVAADPRTSRAASAGVTELRPEPTALPAVPLSPLELRARPR
jgi:hypothetical protein